MTEAAPCSHGSLPVGKLDRLGSLVAENIGLFFPKKKRKDLWKAVSVMALELGYPDAESYMDKLLSSPLRDRGVEALAIHLTVGETYFFRESKSLEALRGHILPKLIRERSRGTRQIRIWSAGCSSGEEPYTAAMLLDMLLPSGQGWDVKILGTDINSLALEKARAGTYTGWSFRGTPQDLQDRYFTKASDKKLVIRPWIRKMVCFSYLNLAGDEQEFLSGNTFRQDIIFCRNVLIYLTPEAVKKVIQRLYRCLNEGGWLVVAPSETFFLKDSEFIPVSFDGTTLFRKDSKKAGTRLFNTDPAPVSWKHDVLSRPLCREPVSAGTHLPGQGSADKVLPDPVQDDKQADLDDLYNKAQLFFREGSVQQAEDLLKNLLEMDHEVLKQSRFSELMARIRADQGILDEAEEWCAKAIKAQKTEPGLYHLMAMIRLEQGRENDAVRELKRSLYLDQDFIAPHYALGCIALEKGSKSEARRHFSNAATLLARIPEEESLPQLGHMSAGRLREIITGLMENGDIE